MSISRKVMAMLLEKLKAGAYDPNALLPQALGVDGTFGQLLRGAAENPPRLIISVATALINMNKNVDDTLFLLISGIVGSEGRVLPRFLEVFFRTIDNVTYGTTLDSREMTAELIGEQLKQKVIVILTEKNPSNLLVMPKLDSNQVSDKLNRGLYRLVKLESPDLPSIYSNFGLMIAEMARNGNGEQQSNLMMAWVSNVLQKTRSLFKEGQISADQVRSALPVFFDAIKAYIDSLPDTDSLKTVLVANYSTEQGRSRTIESVIKP